MPLLRGESEQVREEVFAGSTWHAAYESQRAIRTKRHKYIRRWGERTTPVLPNTDDGPSKDLLLRNGWAAHHIPREQLYDLVFDPNEAMNLAGNPEHADVLQHMRTRLHAWMVETEDPLLAGHVDPPSGVEINQPDQLSASEQRRCFRTPTTGRARTCCCATAGRPITSCTSSCMTCCSTPTRR